MEQATPALLIPNDDGKALAEVKIRRGEGRAVLRCLMLALPMSCTPRGERPEDQGRRLDQEPAVELVEVTQPACSALPTEVTISESSLSVAGTHVADLERGGKVAYASVRGMGVVGLFDRIERESVCSDGTLVVAAVPTIPTETLMRVLFVGGRMGCERFVFQVRNRRGQLGGVAITLLRFLLESEFDPMPPRLEGIHLATGGVVYEPSGDVRLVGVESPVTWPWTEEPEDGLVWLESGVSAQRSLHGELFIELSVHRRIRWKHLAAALNAIDSGDCEQPRISVR